VESIRDAYQKNFGVKTQPPPPPAAAVINEAAAAAVVDKSEL
jgi:hypothetical protein